MNRLLLIFLSIQFVVSCSNKDRVSCYSTNDFLSDKPIFNGKLEYFPNGKLHYSYDTLNGREFGNFFEFDSESCIVAYAFKRDSIKATYCETFSSVNNDSFNIVGKPIVYKTIDVDSKPDSILIEYLITTFSWEGIDFSLSQNGIDYYSISLKDHPKLKFIKTTEFLGYSKTLDRFFLIARFKGRIKGKNDFKIFLDTIDVVRRKL